MFTLSLYNRCLYDKHVYMSAQTNCDVFQYNYIVLLKINCFWYFEIDPDFDRKHFYVFSTVGGRYQATGYSIPQHAIVYI